MPNMSQIYTPAGECPVKLKGTDEATVDKWMDDLMDAGHEKNDHYLPHALKYFASHFYGRGTEDFVAVCSRIDVCYPSNDPPQRVTRVAEKPGKSTRKKQSKTTTELPKQSLGSVARELQRGTDEIKIE